MSVFANIFQRAGRAAGDFVRRVSNNAQPTVTQMTLDAFLESMRNGGGSESRSGEMVNADTAMRCATVYACVRVLAESVAQLPRHVYRRLPNGGKERVIDNPLARLLNLRPNPWQTGFEFFEMLMGHLCLRGNAYAFKNKVSGGKIYDLIPLHPDGMEVGQLPDHRLVYKYTDRITGQQAAYSQDQIWHIRGLSGNGITGVSPIRHARESIGLALATERHGARFFKNGTQLSGIIKRKTALTDGARKNLRESFAQEHGGADSHWKVPILEEDMDWINVGISNEDSQFLETRAFQRTEIAAIYRVPPHKIGDLTRATFSNIEEQNLSFVTESLLAWFVRFEQCIARDLIEEREQADVFVEFIPDALLRGNTLSRYQAHNMAIQGGWKLRNEARAHENMNPLPGMDEPLTPLNMAVGSDPAGAESLKFKRETLRAFIADGTVADVIANATDIKALVGDTGLPRNEEYSEPYLPVRDDTGALVSGGTIEDAQGDVVGGAPLPAATGPALVADGAPLKLPADGVVLNGEGNSAAEPPKGGERPEKAA